VGKILFYADAHLPRTRSAVAELLQDLSRHLPGADGIYLLGDVFHWSVGLRPFRVDAQDELLAFLEGLAARGIDVGYVGGNRDYYLEDMLAGRRGIRFTEESMDVTAYGVPIRLIHGDTVNRADRRYLAWRRFSRSAAVRLAAARLPRRVASALGDRVERSLKQTNPSYRISFPEEACRRYAADAMAEGRRVVLMGHFHEARTLQVGGGELHVLPDWLSTRAHAELHDDGRFLLEVKGP
jgi:UDP-2,3-diacylglucosamine hydrolase